MQSAPPCTRCEIFALHYTTTHANHAVRSAPCAGEIDEAEYVLYMLEATHQVDGSVMEGLRG